MSIRQVIVLSGLCLLFQFCSPIPKLENSNTRIYTEGDTVVAFHLLEKGQEVKAEFDQVYHWYAGLKLGHSQGAYMGQLLDGEYLVKLRSQQLLEKGVFEKGQKEGIWLVWHPNGRVKERQEWKNGLLDGTLEEYDQSGKLIRTSEYKKGMLDGKRTTYLGGDRKHVQEYQEGELEEDEKNAPGLLGRLFKKKENADQTKEEEREVKDTLPVEEKEHVQKNKGKRTGQLQSGGKKIEKKKGFFKRLFGSSDDDRKGNVKEGTPSDKPKRRQEKRVKKGKRSGQLQPGEKNTERKAGFFKRLFGGSKEETKEKE